MDIEGTPRCEHCFMNIALLLSGGTGSRLSSEVPKQYLTVAGKMIITHCLERLALHPEIDAVQIVAAPRWREAILDELPAAAKFRGFSAPGETRQLSIYHGLLDIRDYAGEEDTVIIHDAARPCVSEELISRCLRRISGHDGVLPVLPMTDTVYYSEQGTRVDRLLDRGKIFAGQAPEAFRLGKYLEANRVLLPERILAINGSTEPAVMAGMDVVMIPGEKGNFKITTAEDLARFEELMR